MEFSSADFCKLTINDVSDLLLNDIRESGESRKGALLYGKDNDGTVQVKCGVGV